MKKKILEKFMKKIDKNKYSIDEIERIQYGFEAIYIIVSKSIIIFTISYLLGLLKQTILFILPYAIIRSFACGLHANRSYICTIMSLIIFITIPFLCIILTIPLILKIILNLLSIIAIYKYAPADTKNRPIINKKRRTMLKTISLTIAFIYSGLSFFSSNFFTNTLTLSLVLETVMILPITYKLFKLPYANYKKGGII